MSIKHRIVNIGTGFLVLWLAWKAVQIFMSPIIAQGLLTVAVLGVAAVVLNITGERIIDFVKSATLPTPRLPRMKPATAPTAEDDVDDLY